MASALDNYDLNGILSQLFRVGPTDAEKRQAASQAFMNMGLGVLAANQPSREPRNAAGILAQGGLAGQNTYQSEIDRQGAERKGNASTALQALQIKKQFDQQAALQGLLSGNAQAPAGAGSGGGGRGGGGGGGETPPGMSAQSSQAAFGSPAFATGAPGAPAGRPLPRGYTDIPLGSLQALAASGMNVEQFLKLREAAQPKLENVPGIGMVDPHSGQPVVSMPRITDSGRAAGAVPDGHGGWTVQVPQGSVGAYSQFQNADERAKANFDPFMGQVDASGRPIPQTRLQFAGRVSPEAAAASAAPGAAPGGMGPTPTQSAAAKEVGQGDAQRAQALEQKIPNLVSSLRRFDRMEQLTGDATYSAAGAELKAQLGSIAQAFGLPIQKEKTANTEEYIAHVAEGLKERLASKDYGSGTGISNLDLISASKPLPELAKTEQGRRQIIQAIRSDTQRALGDALAARDYFQQNMSLRGFRYPSESERPPIPKEPAQQPTQKFNALPAAKDYRGKFMRDTTSGQLLQSDGLVWKPAQARQ